jgi:NAD(P)-dependent dehydrogenase (short-subunit alcohol dehydrogenase family)
VRSAVADVTDDSAVQALFDGEARVDHVFLPAGELKPGGGDALGSDLNGLRSILESRLLGVVHVVRRARPKMTGGSITLMAGLYATRPASGAALGAAAVAAVDGLTRALALDLAPIRVNAVAPGLIDTPLWDSFGAQREAILAQGTALPVGRIGRPEEVAAGVKLPPARGGNPEKPLTTQRTGSGRCRVGDREFSWVFRPCGYKTCHFALKLRRTRGNFSRARMLEPGRIELRLLTACH